MKVFFYATRPDMEKPTPEQEKILEEKRQAFKENLKKQREAKEAQPPTPTPRTVSWAVQGAMKAAKAVTLPETEESKARLAICQSCDQWTGTSCKLCGCFVKLKVRIPEEKCPAGKW